MRITVSCRSIVTIPVRPMAGRPAGGTVSVLDPDWHQCVVEVAIATESAFCVIVATEAGDLVGLE